MKGFFWVAGAAAALFLIVPSCINGCRNAFKQRAEQKAQQKANVTPLPDRSIVGDTIEKSAEEFGKNTIRMGAGFVKGAAEGAKEVWDRDVKPRIPQHPQPMKIETGPTQIFVHPVQPDPQRPQPPGR